MCTPDIQLDILQNSYLQMDHLYLEDTKENNQATEAADDSANTSIKELLWLFRPKILSAIEIIRDKKRKCPNIDAIHGYIIKMWASKTFKTLIENLDKELIKQNILINKKYIRGLDSFKILHNVDQTLPTQTLPNPPHILNARKTPDTKNKETLPDSTLFLNDM